MDAMQANSNTPVVLITCMTVLDERLVETLQHFSHEIKRLGGRLVVMSNEADRVYGRKDLEFDLLHSPAFLSEYGQHGAECPPARCSYETLLAEVDSAWLARTESTPVQSLRGIEHCRRVARAVVRALRPSVALWWCSGMLPVSRLWQDVAREMGVPSFCLERGFLQGTWMVDAGGLNVQSDNRAHPIIRSILLDHSGTERVEAYRDWCARMKSRKYGKEGDGAVSLCGRLGIEGGRVIVVFGGLNIGAIHPSTLGAELNQPGYRDARDIVREVDSALEHEKDIVLFFKPHPGEKALYPEEVIGRVRVVHDVEAIELIEIANVVVAGLTTLAYEALLRQRPLVLTARSAIQGTGAAYEALYPGEMGGAIRSALNNQGLHKKQNQADAFLDALLTHSLYATEREVPALSLDVLARHYVGLGGLGNSDIEWANTVLRCVRSTAEKLSPSPIFLLNLIDFIQNEKYSSKVLYGGGECLQNVVCDMRILDVPLSFDGVKLVDGKPGPRRWGNVVFDFVGPDDMDWQAVDAVLICTLAHDEEIREYLLSQNDKLSVTSIFC